MSCEKITFGLDLRCGNIQKQYYQQAILVNRSDILNKQILTSYVSLNDIHTCRHRVSFNLKENKKGFFFSASENSSSIFGVVEKSIVQGNPQYLHSVTILVLGVSENVKCILKQLDYSDYFVALQLYDGTVEVYGFEFGMTTDNYTYDPMNAEGGGVIKLKSMNDALEDELPFIYDGSPSDFDNLFENIVFLPNGDFNNDFSNDFNNY
jgi:hypothetical protein